jgi:TetR/AcrR family transcriptional regulator, repressor for uid operon
MPKLAAEARAERRQRFVDAAWRCAAREGYRDMTVDDVCAEAGLSKGAFYIYFPHKQSLLLALLEDDASYLDRLIEDLDEHGTSSVDRLRRFTRVALQRHEHPGRAQVRADLWSATLTEPKVRAGVAASVERRRAPLRRWVEQGIATGELVDIPANALASILLALTDGLILHAALDPNGFRWPRIARALDLVLEGVSDN